jgi:uncharacterized protein YkwD
VKKVVILLFSFLLFGFKNPNNECTPIIIHFEQILNEYRCSNGLNPVKIDYSMEEFTNLRSKDLLTDFSHKGFDENIHSYISNFTFAGENATKVTIHTNYGEARLSSSINEIEEILTKMMMGTLTNYDVAKHCFLIWKYSKYHNELLLNEKIKRFYLSYQKTENHYYFSFIALN